MDLHPTDQAALVRMVNDLRGMHRERLRDVVLHGEAAGAGYRPRRSPLEVAVVLDAVTPDALRATRARRPAWRRWRIETPLLLDPETLEGSLDVFPLELLEMQLQHHVFYGDHDPFAKLEIPREPLRLAVEEQLRGRLLHLWQGYLEAGGPRGLRRLLEDTPVGFEVILRGLLHLRGDARGLANRGSPDVLLPAVEEGLGLPLPTLRRLAALRYGHAPLAAGELETCFDSYLGEVRALVRAADTLS